MPKPKPKRILYASHWWLEDLMRAVAQQAAERGWYIDFQMAVSRQIPRHWRGDGIVTTLSGDPGEIGAFFKAVGCPVVSLNQNKPEVDVPRVVVDMVAAGRLAAEHFLARSFRSFASYTKDHWLATMLARKGFGAAVGAAGFAHYPLDWEKERRGGRNTWPNRHRWLRRRLRQLPKPLAVLAVGALDPVEIIEACLAESLRVPDDIAVLGHFDTALFRECTMVFLSNITQDFDQHARAGCDLLSRMMDGEPPPGEPILLPPSGIVTRQSTDTIAARIPTVVRAIRYMRAHFADPVEVSVITRISGTSRSRLYAAFEADLGISPHAVLTRIRLDKACRMLRESNQKVGVIALDCGFGDQANFHHQFKQRFKMTPGAYRRRR